MIQIPWPGWQMVRKIGEGSFGSVYEIKHDLIKGEERAAMKVLSVPKNENDIKSMRAEGHDADAITQTIKDQAGYILEEYMTLCELQGTPNIVRCNTVHHEAFTDRIGFKIYIMMELLIPLLDQVNTLLKTESQIVHFGIDMCNALIACERKGIVHRDIKPENIFVSRDGVFKLGDFGVARSLDHATFATKGVGTPAYMAPEVANGEEYSKQADIYSMGIVLYWLLNKRRTPFLPLPPMAIKASDREEALRRRCSGEQIPEPVEGSEALKRIVMKACAFDTKERYLSAKEMRDDLKALCGEKAEELDHTSVSQSGQPQNADGDSTVYIPVKHEQVKQDADSDSTMYVSEHHGKVEQDAYDDSTMYVSVRHGNAQQEDYNNETIGPDFGARVYAGKTKVNKKVVIMAAAGVLALVVVLAVLLFGGKKKGPATPPTYTTPPTVSVKGTTPTEAETTPPITELDNVTITSAQGDETGNTIYWNTVDNATIYLVYRLNGTNWELLGNTNDVAYKDEKAPEEVKCYYKVVARNGDVKSDITTTQSASATRPAMITELDNVVITSAQGHESGNILYWSAVPNANIYQVYRLNGDKWVFLDNTRALGYKDTTAEAGVKHYYKVIARRGTVISDIKTTQSASATRPKA